MFSEVPRSWGQDLESIANILKHTQAMIAFWYKNKHRDKRTLFDTLPSGFYKLLEMITISRSRKHITTYYKTDRLGKFPEKQKPITVNPDIDANGDLLSFENTNVTLESLTLCIYSPMKYIKSEYKTYYSEKFQTVYGGKVLFKHENREMITATLHRFNLFKRLESSVSSFGQTIDRLLERINRTIEQLESMTDADIEFTDSSMEDGETLDYKYEITLKHINAKDYLHDLYYDKELLDALSADIKSVLSGKRDKKISVLREIIYEKIKNMPYNNGNKKVLIFSAFADTAEYLYFQLEEELKGFGVHTAFISGSRPARTNNYHLQQEFNNILRAFSPKSKLGHTSDAEHSIDVLIGTDCISEGQNLQDCDCVINYDIHWNPVSLIQRFGRIDRIGSENEKIQMINFFPNIALNDYLNLEQRVKGKMISVNIASTGDEDLLSPEMNDINFRKRQLERLKDEVIDIDEANDNISLTDLNLNDYLFELADYIKKKPEIKKVPLGIYAVTDNKRKGVIFCFKHSNILTKPKSDSSLYPYYLIYIGFDGEIIFSNLKAREVLKDFREMCIGKDRPDPLLVRQFLKQTKDAKDMSVYSGLLNKAINSIQGEEQSEAQESIFDFGGFDNPFAGETADDFELVTFLVVD